MKGLTIVVAAGTLAMSFASGVPAADKTLDAAAAAMGSTSLRSIEFSGSGSTYGFAQAPGPGEPWPRFVAKKYLAAVDYVTPSMRRDTVRAQGEFPPRGGAGQPMAVDQRTTQLVSGHVAWSENGRNAAAQPGAVTERLRELWMTPHGLIKAAMAARSKVTGNVFAVDLEGRNVRVTLDAAHLVSSAEYMVDNPVLGDMSIVVTYSEYADHDGTRFPAHIVEKTDGYPTLDVRIEDVKINTVTPQPVPSTVSQPAPAALQAERRDLQTQKLADGVWFISASNYGSIAIEFSDHIVMFEGPVDDARSMVANEFVHKTFPGKPITILVNTHAHFDHAGGVREYVAEGATIVTHEMNKAYYEKVWARPRTIHPDRMAQSSKVPVWDTMTDKKVLTDGTRTLELHHIQGNGHNPYIILGYLPKERILLYGDMYNPPAGSDPRDLGRTNEYAENLFHNVERLHLDPVLLAPIHGRPAPFDNLKKAIGVMPLSQ